MFATSLKHFRHNLDDNRKMSNKTITIIGAGITGLWQAFELARRGHRVTVIEASKKPFQASASWIAGAMLAPDCESESAEPVIRDLGLRSIELWRETFPGTEINGSLVLAQPRDQRELTRFARMTGAFEEVDGDRIAELEPALAGRYSRGLFYAREGHMQPHRAMAFMMRKAEEAGAEFRFGQEFFPNKTNAPPDSESDYTIDCRGLAARDLLENLRGVRGEMLIVQTEELSLNRPVRLLHPRFPLYVVPWPDSYFMIGATLIESDGDGPVTVRSALELLGTAYALHPAFGEAEIVELKALPRPAFPDNTPKIVMRRGTLHVNGLYRHGFLVAPALAEAVAGYIETGKTPSELFVEDNRKR